MGAAVSVWLFKADTGLALVIAVIAGLGVLVTSVAGQRRPAPRAQ